jgi:hypothetical protein
MNYDVRVIPGNVRIQNATITVRTGDPGGVLIQTVSTGGEHPAAAKLESFRLLNAGWDFGRGGPISNAVIAEARNVLYVGLNMGYDANVFPGSADAIAIAFYWGRDCVEAVVDGSGQLEIFVEEVNGGRRLQTNYEEAATLADLRRTLEDWGPFRKWSLSDLSTLGTSISFDSVSATSHSPTHRDTVPVRQMASVGFR